MAESIGARPRSSRIARYSERARPTLTFQALVRRLPTPNCGKAASCRASLPMSRSPDGAMLGPKGGDR